MNGTDYGLPPNTTPTGVPNPDPNGDLWIDLANNNIMFQYYSNSEFGTGSSNDVQDTTESQLMVWGGRPEKGDFSNTTGWYFVQDSSIKARLEAFAAESRADYAIDTAVKVFAEPHEIDGGTGGRTGPRAHKAGDIWYDVSDNNRQYIADGPADYTAPTLRMDIANHGANGILGHTKGVSQVGPMYFINGDAEYDHTEGPWHWVETRDKNVLFALAGNDPFNLNPFFSRGYEESEQTPDGWFPCKTLNDNPYYEHPTQGAVTFSGPGSISRSRDAQSGDGNNAFSMAITPSHTSSGTDPTLAVWSNTFPVPLMTNSFITGAFVARKDGGTGIPGLIIDVYHRVPGEGNSNQFTRSIATVGDENTTSQFGYMDIPFVAKAPHSREIYRLDFRAGYADITANNPGNVNDRTGVDGTIETSATQVGDTIQTGGLSNTMTSWGDSTAFFDQIYFDVNHPDLATDREGSILFSSLKDVTITNSHFEAGTIDGSIITNSTISNPQISTDYTITANQIEAGTISVGINVGESGISGGTTIVIDGASGRIIIRDST